MTAPDITALLDELSGGNRTVVDRLMPLVYDGLREMARRQLAGERAGHTFSSTALVHEAYLKLVDQRRVTWRNRAHFYGIASRAMRRILLNYARERRAAKRGGGMIQVTLEEALLPDRQPADMLLALDEALDRLAALSDRQARVVECRFFGGLTHEEIAEALGVSVPTVRRDWRLARAWLSRELETER